MKNDLLKRLAITAGMIELGEKIAWGSDSALMREAAAEIERLNAELESIGAGGVSALVPVRNATTAGELTDEQIKETLIAAGHVPQWPSGDIHPAAYAGALAIIAADRALRQAGQGPVGRLEGVDEYGPRLEWMTHWVNVPVGTKFYTAPPAAQVPEGYEALAVKELGPLVDALNRAESKGYLPDAVADEWAAFDFRPLGSP